MNNTFFIGSLIGRLKLGLKHHKECIIVKKTRNIEIILKLLFKENFIKNYIHYQNDFIVFLKYRTNSIIKNIEIISKPSKKFHVNLYDLKSLLHQNNLCFYILSTNQGIMFGKNAIKLQIGGEVLLKVTL